MSEPRRIPTVDDLRVKMCYICREEERYDVPQQSKTAWTHPCNCTLVAHESCLLHWIQSSQQNPSTADKAFACPQCGTKYEIESDRPLTLRILNSLNKRLTYVGNIVTYTGIGVTFITFGTCLYILCTSYGAWAVREFIGKEMFDILLTEDPSNWPWHAFFNLPVVPLTLLMYRSDIGKSSMTPIFPLFLVWPSSIPALNNPYVVRGRGIDSEPVLPSLFSWPPAPIVATFLYPITLGFYRRLFSKFQHWILGTKPSARPRTRRYIWNLNRNAELNVEINIEEGNALRPRAPREQGAEALQQQEGDVEPENAADAAARTQNINNASLGRFIGGALIIPKISSIMGSLLFRLSKHSSWLRRFLAIKPPPSKPWYVLPEHDPLDDLGQAASRVVRVLFGRTGVWHDADPVWWRNSVGLGIYVLMRDCISLLHLYLAKRELETRRVKNKSFLGIDMRELDLVHPASFFP